MITFSINHIVHIGYICIMKVTTEKLIEFSMIKRCFNDNFGCYRQYTVVSDS